MSHTFFFGFSGDFLFLALLNVPFGTFFSRVLKQMQAYNPSLSDLEL